MQVNDDLELLDLMMKDFELAPEIFSATNYWKVYESKILSELKNNGLNNFRGRNSMLRKFGAVEILPWSKSKIDLSLSKYFNNIIFSKIPSWEKILSFLNKFLGKILPVTSDTRDIRLFNNIRHQSYEYLKLIGAEYGAKSIDDLIPSLNGNPEDVVNINGKVFPSSIFRLYMDYAYCCRYVDFDSINVLVELGGGSGKQIEVIKKLHPHITVLLFDIPPQLYVCEQYLSSVFSESVVSYRDTIKMESAHKLTDGKIYFFGNWKFPILENVPIDLFWNAASFQEMEPDNVSEYIKYINSSANHAFLSQTLHGQRIAKEAGSTGVLEPTTLSSYKNGLSNFRILDISPHWDPISGEYFTSNTFWKRNSI